MASPFSGVNLREQERKLMRVPAMLTFADGSSCEARTLNVSESGMGVVAPVNPRDGARVTVIFRLPTDPSSAPPLKVPADVRNSVLSGADSGFRLGLQFVNAPASALSMIKAYTK
jgi:hypothetical protein